MSSLWQAAKQVATQPMKMNNQNIKKPDSHTPLLFWAVEMGHADIAARLFERKGLEVTSESVTSGHQLIMLLEMGQWKC